MSTAERKLVYKLHALPPLWWNMAYEEFLVARRLRMAQVVREAWESLIGDTKTEPVATPSIAELIAGGETGATEFKSTLRTNLHTGQHDEKIHLSALNHGITKAADRRTTAFRKSGGASERPNL